MLYITAGTGMQASPPTVGTNGPEVLKQCKVEYKHCIIRTTCEYNASKQMDEYARLNLNPGVADELSPDHRPKK